MDRESRKVASVGVTEPVRRAKQPPGELLRPEIALVTAICLAWVFLIWLWNGAYLALCADDAFYYFKIAQNLGAGLGPTFDGQHLTNGFHLPWALVLVPLTWLADDPVVFVRLVLSVQTVLVGVAMVSLARRLKRTEPTSRLLETGVLALAVFYLAKTAINGQESALVFMLICLLLGEGLSEGSPRSHTRESYLGCLLGLLVLARLDAAVFSLLFWCLYGVRARREGRVGSVLRVGAAAAVPIAVWVVWSALTFGAVFPVSGVVKLTQGPLGVARVAGAVGLATLGVGLWQVQARRWAPVIRRACWPLTAYAAAIVVYQFGLRGLTAPESWVLAPILLLVLITIDQGRKRWPGWLKLGAFVVWIAVLIASWQYRLLDSSNQAAHSARTLGEWASLHIPPDQRVAGWDIGSTTWHSGLGVENLEGLVNSSAFATEVLAMGAVGTYLENSDIEWLLQPIWRSGLDFGPPVYYEGVDLSGWRVAYAECVPVGRFWRPSPVTNRVYLALTRDAQFPRFSDCPTLTEFVADRVDRLCEPAAHGRDVVE